MSVCDALRSIGTYASSPMIDPCNAAGSIGTYDPNFNGDHTFDGGGGCGCTNTNELTGRFTSNDYLLNPKNIFSSGNRVLGILELFVWNVSTSPDAWKTGYYYYYINSESDFVTGSNVNMKIITNPGEITSVLPANSGTASNQIKYVKNVGVTFKTTAVYNVFWKFSFSYK